MKIIKSMKESFLIFYRVIKIIKVFLQLICNLIMFYMLLLHLRRRNFLEYTHTTYEGGISREATRQGQLYITIF